MFRPIPSLKEYLTLCGVHPEWLCCRVEQRSGWNCVEATFSFVDSGHRALRGKEPHPTIRVPLLLQRSADWEQLRTFLGAFLEYASRASAR
jgi:hypothetical protein